MTAARHCSALLRYNANLTRAEHNARLRDGEHVAELPQALIDHEWREKFELERAAGRTPTVTLGDAVAR